MSEQQLERSVLEGKDREELFAIADALGTKPGSRAKKADLVDQILQATGVPVSAEAAEKPKRTRSGRSKASNGADSGEAAAPDQAEEAGNGQVAHAEAAAEMSPGGTGANGTGADPNTADAPPADVANTGRGGGRAGAPGDGGGAPATGEERQSAPRGENRGARDQHERRFDSEPANRRNRRRRGRDRGGDRTERDLQGQGAEQQFTGEPVPVAGFLDLRDEGYGFLRTSGFLPAPRDVYVSISQARRFALRKGDYVEGASRPAGTNEKYPALLRIDTIGGLTPDEARLRPKFEDLTPLFPDEKLRLEIPGDPANMTARIVDLISPIGKGQRGLIVSPPKAGKTTVLKQIAHSIEANNPEVHLMVLLVDERPEEVTDMRRSVKGEVIASTFDRPSDEHTMVAELAIERAKRLVEMEKDVVIVLDGITRLARAYNLAQPATGRIMSGGIDTGALYPPKKFFGSARNIEEGGSLTILATALVETGSRMDEVIFEEFKGTGNMELRLDRRLAERRIYPALDVNASSTRHEELLFDRTQLQQVWKLRRVLNALASDGSGAPGLELLMDKVKTTKSNDEFLAEIAKGPAPAV
jgi:transcription termination factor Rho